MVRENITIHPEYHHLTSNHGVSYFVPDIRIYRSAQELEELRPVWRSLFSEQQGTIFQDFDWNLLAARMFADREELLVVHAQASFGAAIVPAVLRRRDHTLRLLGEELFDYRGFMHCGEEEVLVSALAALSRFSAPFEAVAVRECDRRAVMQDLDLVPFTASPSVNCAEVSSEQFANSHLRLGRNLRRLQRLGLELRTHNGNQAELLRFIYAQKAACDPASLFHDQRRVEFMVEAAGLDPERCEIFTLQSDTRLAAALVTLRDDAYRRCYTCWFDAEFGKHSPSLTLIYEVTRQSLAAGLSCDYMTGEQPYKLRLATSSMPLYKLRASVEQLAALAEPVEMRLAG